MYIYVCIYIYRYINNIYFILSYIYIYISIFEKHVSAGQPGQPGRCPAVMAPGLGLRAPLPAPAARGNAGGAAAEGGGAAGEGGETSGKSWFNGIIIAING